MEKHWKSKYLQRVEEDFAKGDKLYTILTHLYLTYSKALLKAGRSPETIDRLLLTFYEKLQEQLHSPYSFAPYHKRVRAPFDSYQFGIDFVEPLVDHLHSTVRGLKHLEEISKCLERKENVILLANHQSEADPQAISILLQTSYPKIAEEMIFVAGERVVTDPSAIPFSMGRDLLCIYSKRYIDHPPELKLKKQLHNKKTMQLMSELLSEGGKCIYVAPSGGRDRPGVDGTLQLAPFDPQSVEMFYLMAKKAGHLTHFYPLALSTYAILPPPNTIQRELGEMRFMQHGAIHLAFGPRIDMENIPLNASDDKHAKRKARAQYAFDLVQKDYQTFG